MTARAHVATGGGDSIGGSAPGALEVPGISADLGELASRLRGETVFITGGSGFIGSTLAGVLLEHNAVIAYDNLSRDRLSDTAWARHPNLTVVRGDVLELDRVREHMQPATYVVHCAGVTGIDTVVRRPVTTMQVNMIGSANVLEAASELSSVRRVVCFSTSEVFGQIAFQSEETSPAVLGAVGEARWTYAVSKLAEEHLAYAYFKERGLPTVSLRPFNVYGPGQVGEGALRGFIERALAGEEIVIHGDGTQIRAWCYVEDMLEGVLRSLLLPQAVGESFNIGNPRTIITIYGLANTVLRVLDSQSTIRFQPKVAADIELRIPQVKKARELLGFEAKVDLEDGIRRTAAFYAGRSGSHPAPAA